jgi:hypothetical protein
MISAGVLPEKNNIFIWHQVTQTASLKKELADVGRYHASKIRLNQE